MLFLGELVPARAHLEEGLILYALEQHRSLTFRYGQDSKVTCLGYAAWALWLLGYPDQAWARMYEMLTLAQELSHPFTLVFALNWAACVHRFRREWPLLHKRAEEVIALSREHGFVQRVATGTILRGGALAEQGQKQEGIEQICQGLAAFRATGSEVGLPQYASLLIEAYRAVEQFEEAMHVLAEALTLVDKHREHFWEAELHREGFDTADLQEAGALLDTLEKA